MLSYNNLSDLLKVDPLPSGEVATYQLLTVGKNVDANSQSKLLQTNSGVYRPGKVSIFDEGDGKLKVIANVINTQAVVNEKGEQYERYDVERVAFGRSGTMNVYHNEPEKYIFMERHPENASNPFRDKRIPALFERVDPEKPQREAVFMEEITYDAMNLVRTLKTEELLKLAPKLNVDVDADPDTIKFSLSQISRKSPEKFILASSDAALKVKTIIGRAVADGKLKFNLQERAWMKGKTVLVEAKEGESKMDAMNAFLQTTEGKAFFKTLNK